MGKVTGFAGYEAEDIVLYLSKILTALGNKVAIVDRTEQEMLLELIGIYKRDGPAWERREGEYEGIWITDQGIDVKEFDYVFFLFGYRLLHPKLYECEYLVMLTDGVPAHASLLRRVGTWERKQFLIIRNIVPMKHTNEYLVLLTANKDTYYRLPYNEKDMRMRCSIGSGNQCHVRNLSAEMKQLMLLLIQFLEEEVPEQAIYKMLRKL